MSQLLTIRKAAARLGQPPHWVYKLIQLGLPTCQLVPRGSHYIDVDELDAWIAAHKTAVVTPPPVAPATDAEECAALGIPLHHEFS